MTVRLAKDVGMPLIAEYARRFGIYDDLQPVLSMALGAFLEGGDDRADMPKGDRREVAPGGEKPSARPADRPEAAR